ncbi:MAG: phenylacetate--CoA ligase family protein [Candidatus Odinarchaeota archaeon]
MKYSQDVQEEQLAELLKRVAENTPFYREKFEKISFDTFSMLTFNDLPTTTADDLHRLADPDDLYYDQGESHYVFIKDGTEKITGASFWNINYLEKQIEILVNVFAKLGLSQQDRVMNLFVPGISGVFHLFNLVLEKTGVTAVPLGGESELPVIARFIADLQVNVLLGEPAMLVSVLEYLADNHPEIAIETIFIVGEAPTREQHDVMKGKARKVYFSTVFSFETGVIGTQCSHLPLGTFHLSSTVLAELIDPESGNSTGNNEGELVVTDLLDRASPCIRYRTGKRIKILEQTCTCGSSDPLFRLESTF